MIVPDNVKQERMAICVKCKWYKETTGSCGTLIVANFNRPKDHVDIVIEDNIVRHYRKKVKLCGCKMSWKTQFNWAMCPADKWYSYGISNDELVRIKELLEQYKHKSSLTYLEAKPLFMYASKVSGKNIEQSTCPECVRRIINDLRKATEDIVI
jgi:hypothetical protein